MPNDPWRLMQAIESNRYRAELLEARARDASPRFRELLIYIAAQRRALADQRYAIAHRQPPGPLPPLWGS